MLSVIHPHGRPCA